MKITYIDDRGYQRYKETNRLVHRDIAWKYVYSANRKKYPLRFSEYQVHHIDGDKRNNKWSNLELITKEEHEESQGYKFKETPYQQKNGEPNYGYNIKPYQGERIKSFQEIMKPVQRETHPSYSKNYTFWTPKKLMLIGALIILTLIIISR